MLVRNIEEAVRETLRKIVWTCRWLAYAQAMRFTRQGIDVSLLGVGLVLSACTTRPAVVAVSPEPSIRSISSTEEPPDLPVSQSEDDAPPEDPDEGPGLDPTQVATVVTSKYGVVGGCHTIEFSGRAQRPGSILLDWVINPDGSVRRVDVAESSFVSSQFHSCVLTVARDLQFPAAVGKTEVSWRFRFRESGARPNQAASLQ